MPIYEYVCASCGTKSDHLMRLSDPDPTECPNCTDPKLSKALSAPSFRLAGSGWYETDFKKDGDKKRNLVGDAGESKAADSKSNEGKPAESKTETTTAPSAPAVTSTSPASTPPSSAAP